MKILLILFVSYAYAEGCYWNDACPYSLFGTKTPYETIRGDIRDQVSPTEGCETISAWLIHRHGNRYPGDWITDSLKKVAELKDEIISSFYAGTSELCAQDVENLRNWSWPSIIDENNIYLTKTGYDEFYNIGKRFAEKYHKLLQGSPDQFYFRATNGQRNILSCTAFIQGIKDRIPLNVTVADPWPKDHVIKPYEPCERYEKEIIKGPVVRHQEDMYYKSQEFISVQKAIQKRFGIATNLTVNNIDSLYQLCRYFRPWTENFKSPWCAAFSNKDLVVMEYSDDVNHYYKKGHGSWVNAHFGQAPLKDLYESFKAVVSGEGKKLIVYFTHGTMMEMIYSALGLYHDSTPLQGATRNPDRQWRTSFFGAFSSNMMVVLNRCGTGDRPTYKVQIYINEKPTPICPPEGCTWSEFQKKFQSYTTPNMTLCTITEHETSHGHK